MISINNKVTQPVWLLIGSTLFLQNIEIVLSHGRMMEPPQRSSLWRFNYPGAEPNYNDMELFCGGFSNQWENHGGKCGVCGDPYQGPRLNEAGNKYGKGIIAKTYNQGASINVQVLLTANHMGYFEFRLCVHNNPTVPITEDCFNNHLLYIEESADTKYSVEGKGNNNLLSMTVRLPSAVTCSQCVLRWKYNTGNSWGCSSTGNCGLGLGRQEQFYNCADIAIVGTGSATGPTSSPSTTTPAPSTTTEARTTTTTTVPTTTTHRSATLSVINCPRGHLNCVGKSPYNTANMVTWCNDNCNYIVRYCPETHCSCTCQI